jgi:hypothetical protein
MFTVNRIPEIALLWSPSQYRFQNEAILHPNVHYIQIDAESVTLNVSRCHLRKMLFIQAFQLHGDLYTMYFFSLFWGHVFFAFQHNLGTYCCGELLKLVWISVAKIWSRSLILLFPLENHTFGISGINLCHLGAELSILTCRKRFRGGQICGHPVFLTLYNSVKNM